MNEMKINIYIDFNSFEFTLLQLILLCLQLHVSIWRRSLDRSIGVSDKGSRISNRRRSAIFSLVAAGTRITCVLLLSSFLFLLLFISESELPFHLNRCSRLWIFHFFVQTFARFLTRWIFFFFWFCDDAVLNCFFLF